MYDFFRSKNIKIDLVFLDEEYHSYENYVLDDERGAEGRAMRAKLLGRPMNNKPDADVTDFLLEIADKDPDKIAMIHISKDKTERRFTFKDIKGKKGKDGKKSVFMRFAMLPIVLPITCVRQQKLHTKCKLIIKR